MKTIGVKKLAAIVGGAALVGTALAPLAAAAVSLQKSDVYNSSMQPLVNVVVGEKASNMDVWNAGRIALAIQQGAVVEKSYQPTGGSTSTGTANVNNALVRVTVGGTVKLSGGARELSTADLNSNANANVEYQEGVGNTYFKSFSNTTKNATRDGNSTFSLSSVETVNVRLNARMDVTNTSVKDLVANINPSDVNYTVALSPGVVFPFTDAGSNDYIPVSFMGKPYVIDSITSNSVVLVSDNAEKIYMIGDSIPAKGRDGKDYLVVFDGGASVGSANVANITLKDANGTTLQSLQFAANSDIVFRENGNEILSTKVRLKNIGSTTQNNNTVYSFTALVGADRVEVRQGREVPYDPNSTGSNIAWTASLSTSGSTLTGINMSNNNYFMSGSTPLYSSEYSFNPTGKETEFGLFKGSSLENVGKIKFRGFYDAGVQRSMIEFKGGTSVATGSSANTYGAINYTDVSGQIHSIPMAIRLTAVNGLTSGSTFTFDSMNHAYATDSPTAPTVFRYQQNSSDSNLLASTTDGNILLPAGDVNYTNAVVLLGQNSKTYTYYVKKGNTGSNAVWLVLAGPDANATIGTSGLAEDGTGFIDNVQYSAGSIYILGTSLSDANISTANAAFDYNNVGGTARNVSYYYPDSFDFNGEQQGTSTQVYRTAQFRIREGATSATVPADQNIDPTAQGIFTIFIDTEGGNAGTVDTANINKLGYSGKTTAVQYWGRGDQNLLTFSEYLGGAGESSSNYKRAYTDYGSKVVLENRNLTVTLPDRRVKSFFTVESNEVTTTTTGGEDLIIRWGETGTTTAGAKVTVADINGVTVTGGTTTVDGNMPAFTYMEPAASNGKPMIQTDASSPSGSVVLVGGPAVNRLTAMIAGVDDMFQSEGAKADVTTYTVSGTPHILVAGYSESDTTAAANEFIAWLESQ